MNKTIGPKFEIGKSCRDCQFYEKTDLFFVCNKSGKRLNAPIPDEKCPFANENLKKFHKMELNRLKASEEQEKIYLLKEIFFECWDIEFESENKISLLITEFDSKIVKKLNQYFPDWEWDTNTDYDSGLKLYLWKND